MNSDLVLVRSNNTVTTSKIVADAFGKRYRNVNRKIQQYKKDLLNFEQMFYSGYSHDSYGRKQPMWFMNRDGFFVLAGGFTGKKALKLRVKFIHAFDIMENELKHKLTIKSPKSSWILAVYNKQKYIENVKPKVDYYNKILGSKDTAPISIASKRFGLTPNALNLILWRHGVQFKRGKTWYLTRKYQSKGFAKHVPYYVSEYHTAYNLKWFAKGLKFITELLLENGYKIIK